MSLDNYFITFGQLSMTLANEGLYSKASPLWSDPPRKAARWNELAENLGVELQLLHTWYKTLRKDLETLKKRAKKSGSGAWNYNQKTRWDHWQFLNPFINEVAARSTPSLKEPLAPAALYQHFSKQKCIQNLFLINICILYQQHFSH